MAPRVVTAMRPVKPPDETGQRAAEEFLSALWGEGPEDGLITLFTLPGRRVAQFGSAYDAAVSAAAMDANDEDVYVNVASIAKIAGAGRGKASDARLLSALAIDLDVVGEGRKKRCFATLGDAVAFLAKLPLTPSLLVSSGGGLHCWWSLKEPELAASALPTWVGWLRFVQSEAVRIGVDVDPVADLARVLRIPGTMNRKYGKPIRVSLIDEASNAELRYSLSDFSAYLPSDIAIETTTAPKAAVKIGGLVLATDAQPPIAKFMALMEADPKFKASWNNTRKDLKDGSPSGYDMSLANIAARAGWSDQEIADLLIAHRAKSGSDLKLREKYYQDTIDNARKSIKREDVIGEIVATGSINTDGEEGRAKVFDFFSAQTGATVKNVLRSFPKGERFVFEFDGDKPQVHLALKELTDWKSFWHVLSSSGFCPYTQRPKEAAWLELVNALVRVSDPLEMEINDEEAMIIMLVRGLAWNHGVDLKDPKISNTAARELAIRDGGAFFWDGKVWSRLSGLRDQATLARIQGVNFSRLRAGLRAIGAERRVINAQGVGGTCYGLTLAQLATAGDLRNTTPSPRAEAGGTEGREP